MRYTISTTLTSLLISASAVQAEVPRVMTDFAPAGGLVALVMGDLGAPEVLLDKGANAHDFQLRPSQSAALQDAGLVVWIGPGMTPWLERALKAFPDTAQLRLNELPGTYIQDFGAQDAHDHDHDHDKAHGHDDGHDHDHDHGHDDHAAGAKDHEHDHGGHEGDDAQGQDEHGAGNDGHDHEASHDHDGGHDHAHDEGHEGHSHEGPDPHTWLDPANGALWLDAIAEELSRRDPENAETYVANATAGKALIAATDAANAAKLAPLKDKPFVVFHDAYGYFAGHYGLSVAGAIRPGDASSPGAAHLVELREKAGGQALCLFPEVAHDPKLLTQMAEATGVRVGAPLDPEGVGLTVDRGTYPALLTGLADTLADCLGAN
ncbi:zinc ABC transporter substrate-binding protein [Gemmobacter serpentinus]|uniref:zinc ABC transporter substrate-binding protein n=1 Tax=Gemmobacter serpentinus TaxID=2652247 RepID=UPI00124E79C0|nr:zinc ABC transporter substrate-binding protein [Gemmobacter serpentinus]